MHRITLFIAAILFSFHSGAQEHVVDGKTVTKKPKKELSGKCPIVYLNVSTGLNNNGGIIGVGVDIAVAKKVSLDAGVGIGTWGEKFYIGGKYYLKPCQRGWAFGGGLTYATGMSNFNDNLETVDGNTEPVTLNLLPQTNVFIAAYKYWNLGKRYNRIYLEMGWSVALSGAKIQQTAGTPIDQTSEFATSFIAPGGLIAAAGFSFGMPRK